MPWCPNCKTEYRDGFFKCSDCGAELVDELPQEPQKQDENFNYFSACSQPVFFLSSNNEVKIRQITDLLRQNEIAYFTKNQPYGSHLKLYFGQPSSTADIYVDEKDINTATEIVAAYLTTKEEISKPASSWSNTSYRSFDVRKTITKILIRIWLFFIIFSFIISVIYIFIQFSLNN